jgi:hypothetical protein
VGALIRWVIVETADPLQFMRLERDHGISRVAIMAGSLPAYLLRAHSDAEPTDAAHRRSVA